MIVVSAFRRTKGRLKPATTYSYIDASRGIGLSAF